MSSTYLSVNAWREILARVFNDPDLQSNISPDWLINPATRRRLKLDYLCQSIGVAVRFSGLTGKGRRRPGDRELLEEDQRDQIRDELCRLHGIQLAVIDPFDDPVKQMDRFLTVLSRASRSDSPGWPYQPGERCFHGCAGRGRAKRLSTALLPFQESGADGWNSGGSLAGPGS